MDDLVFRPAHELASQIRERSVSASEVVDAYLRQIARHNPAVNAIVTPDEERARLRAKEADTALAHGELWGPLHGVPFTIKDALETAGVRTTSGFPPLRDYVPTRDATVVARLRGAGGILLGKSNLPTLAAGGLTDNPIFGRTNNPWDLERTPGGSTGGGGAALAAGMTPLDVGSDAGGSVRIPAHFCGVYALKPTQHRVPLSGHIPPPPPLRASQMLRYGAVIGPLARSVADLELALSIVAGPDGQDWAVPPAALARAPRRRLQDLRFAWCDNFGGMPITGDTHAALARVADELERHGCRVEQRAPDGFDFVAAWETYGELWQAQVGAAQSAEQETADANGYDPHGDDAFFRGVARGANATARQYAAILARRDAFIAALETFFGDWDVLLCPVSLSPATPHAPLGEPLLVNQERVPYWTGTMAYCCPFNLTGHPALVLPAGRSAEGLPIGLQVVGPLWGEMDLLAIGARLGEVLEPFQRPSGY
ncbi:MAG TPA: amidase [Herpetosiphonaceae bacterium]|nr:amidase [Herpetosiphonaceae bacterium]